MKSPAMWYFKGDNSPKKWSIHKNGRDFDFSNEYSELKIRNQSVVRKFISKKHGFCLLCQNNGYPHDSSTKFFYVFPSDPLVNAMLAAQLKNSRKKRKSHVCQSKVVLPQ